MNERVDGWVDKGEDGQTDGWMKGRMGGCRNGQTDGKMHGWMKKGVVDLKEARK